MLPPQIEEGRDVDRRIAQVLHHSMSRALGQLGVFDVFHAGDASGSAADLALTTSLCTFADSIVLDLRLTMSGDGHELWSSSEVLDLAGTDPRSISIVAQVMADQICAKVRLAGQLGDEKHVVTRSVLSAIEQLFLLSDNDIEGAEASLFQASEVLPSSPIYAWRAYLTAFQVEKAGRDSGIIEKAEHLAARAMELDPTNPLTRALVSHVQSFVLRDLDRAAEILEPVSGMAGTNVMLADAVGLLHYYRSDYSKAHTFAQLSCELGKWSRFRYAFTTSLSMAQLMRGDYKGAISSSTRAIAQHPIRSKLVYEPTLRTLASSLALSGGADMARETLHRLDRQGGGRAIEKLVSPENSPFPNSETFQIVKSSLETLYA